MKSFSLSYRGRMAPDPNSPRLVIASLLQGFLWLGRPGIRGFVWIPLLVNFLLYGLALWLAIHHFSAFMQWLLPAWLDFLRWVLWPLFAVAFFTVMYFSFTVVANLLGSPFYGFLAERTWSLATGKAVPELEMSWGRAILKGFKGESRRLAYLASRAVPVLLLFLIPGVNIVAPVLWLVLNAWFLGLEYMAYPMEACGRDFTQERQLTGRFRFGVGVFGGLVLLGFVVPVLNVFMGPAAVVGATLYLSKMAELG
jgi:CysZ protein